MYWFFFYSKRATLKYSKLIPIFFSIKHRKPEGDPILSPELISDSWTLPFLQCKLLWMALSEYLVSLVRMRFLTSGRSLKHYLFAVFKLTLQFLIHWEVNLYQKLPYRWNKKYGSYQGATTDLQNVTIQTILNGVK